MFKVFIKGLVFGSGFSIAFLAFGFITYTVINNQDLPDVTYTGADLDAWNKMNEIDRIKEASAIAVVKYEENSKNHFIAYVSEVHKKPSVSLDLRIGDRFPKADSNVEQGSAPSGAVAFFIGNPASVTSVLMLYNGVALGLGDMPAEAIVEIFTNNKNP